MSSDRGIAPARTAPISPKGGHQLAEKANFSHRLVFRKPGERCRCRRSCIGGVGHFAAILGEAKRPIRGQPTQCFRTSGTSGLTPTALDAEASGYFLNQPNAVSRSGSKSAGPAEASSVGARGQRMSWPVRTRRSTAQPRIILAGPTRHRAHRYTAYLVLPHVRVRHQRGHDVSLDLSDMPVGCMPAQSGPAATVRLAYDQRDPNQPANFNFFNVSQKWTAELAELCRGRPRPRRERASRATSAAMAPL